MPPNGAAIALVNVPGLPHRPSDTDILAVTRITTSAVVAVVLLYYLTGTV